MKIIHRHREHLLIHACLVLHQQRPDGPAADDRTGNDGDVLTTRMSFNPWNALKEQYGVI